MAVGAVHQVRLRDPTANARRLCRRGASIKPSGWGGSTSQSIVLIEAAPPEKRAGWWRRCSRCAVAAGKLTAVAIVTEVGTFQRFRKPTELMGYTGLVPSEYSSVEVAKRRGRITRTGNAHLRHVLGEAAWHARQRPWINKRLRKTLPTVAGRRLRDRLEGPGAPASYPRG